MAIIDGLRTHPKRKNSFRPTNPVIPMLRYKGSYYRFGGIKRPRGFFPWKQMQDRHSNTRDLESSYDTPKVRSQRLGGLPVVPFSLLVLQRLQARIQRYVRPPWTREISRILTDMWHR